MVSFEASHVFEPCIFFLFRVDLWNASNLKFGDEFLGGVRVPLRALGQAGVHDAWWEEHRSLTHHIVSFHTRLLIRQSLGSVLCFFPPLTALGGFEFIIVDIQSMCNQGNEYQHWQQSSVKVVGVDFAEHERTFPALLTQQSLFLYFFFSLRVAFGKLNTLPS